MHPRDNTRPQGPNEFEVFKSREVVRLAKSHDIDALQALAAKAFVALSEECEGVNWTSLMPTWRTRTHPISALVEVCVTS